MALECGRFRIPFVVRAPPRPSYSSLRSRQNARSVRRSVTAGLEEIFHNQVLISATLAGISAQLLKPLSSALAGKGFNWKLIIRSGGMPSAHAAGVMAAATALGLERGWSDSVFGFSLVMAAIVMYDAQGVRRAVGKQAEVLNTMAFTFVFKNGTETTYSISTDRLPVAASSKLLETKDQIEGDNYPAKANVRGPFSRSTKFFEAAETLPSMKEGEVSIQEIGNEDGWRHIPLKESVGHTKLQVLAGALFGATVTIASHILKGNP